MEDKNLEYKDGVILWAVDIVSNNDRVTLELSDWIYQYIPMTIREASLFAPYISDPCWRLRLPLSAKHTKIFG